jgi:hypothetical protein
MDDIITKIIDLLKVQLTTTYKKYYYGENVIPEQALFPFIEVIPNSTSISNRGTGGTKDNQFSVTIRIKDTIKNFINANTNQEKHSAMQAMVKRMEERTNNTFKNTSVLYVLANNLQLGGQANINDNWEISYDVLPLNGSYIIIASVTFNVNLLSYI